jgi:hypothetical protein
VDAQSVSTVHASEHAPAAHVPGEQSCGTEAGQSRPVAAPHSEACISVMLSRHVAARQVMPLNCGCVHEPATHESPVQSCESDEQGVMSVLAGFEQVPVEVSQTP